MFRRIILISAVAVFIAISTLSALFIEKGTTELNEALKSAPEEMKPIIVVMKEQYNPQLLYDTVKNLPKTERRELTINTLKQFSEQTQESIKKEILKWEKSKMVESIHFLWIYNSISMNASLRAIEELNKRDDVESILYDPKRNMILEDDELQRSNPVRDIRLEEDISYNIPQIGADKVWEEGYYGQGVLVAVLDSGLNYNHTDIKNNLWINPNYPKYGYSFAYNRDDPMDKNGHGTHCSGTVAGDGTSGVRTGVAPESKVMAIQVLDDGGRGSDTTLNRGLQFAIENEADVLSISLGWYHKLQPNRVMLRNTMMNVLSAGIIASVAAGNAGVTGEYPIPDNVAVPGSCPPPWLSPDQIEKGGLSAVFTVGATDQTDTIADFSSKGPVTWQDIEGFNDYPYNPGTGLIVPDISAPGVDVVSLKYDDNTGYIPGSGTSMATPTTAGALALLISKDPTLTPEQIAQIVEETAVKKTDRKSNEYGAGRIDIEKACKRIIDTRPPGQPFNVLPKDKSIEVITYTPLRWKVNLPTSKCILFLGTDNPPTNIINGLELEDVSYVPTDLLKPDTEYFWRVDARNSYGEVQGEVWSFRTVLPITINFENNEFAPYEWDFVTSGQGAQKWFISDNVAFEGVYSAQSGSINHASSTRMRLSTQIKEDGIISFYVKTSTEKNGDFLRFYIDNEMTADWSGENDWAREVFPVKAGYHTFSWIYIKDTMTSAGEDAVWIDDITLPRHFKPNVAYAPEELSINLDWEIEINEDANPIEFALQGFNVYMQSNEGEYTKVNENIIPETNYSLTYDRAGDYIFYTTAVYKIRGKIVETEPSNIAEVVINPSINAPHLNPEAGEYNEPVMLTIEAQEGSEVFYTLDGSKPNYTSHRYEGSFEITETTIVKAFAYILGHLPSEIVVGQYIINTTSVDEEFVMPSEFTINLYPNPIRGVNSSRSSETLNIELSVPQPLRNVDIDIYNIKGQLIRNLHHSNMNRGIQHIEWDLKTNQGRTATNGIYLLKVKADERYYHRRVMLLR